MSAEASTPPRPLVGACTLTAGAVPRPPPRAAERAEPTACCVAAGVTEVEPLMAPLVEAFANAVAFIVQSVGGRKLTSS